MSVALKTDQRTAVSGASSNVRKPLPEIALVGTCALLYSLMRVRFCASKTISGLTSNSRSTHGSPTTRGSPMFQRFSIPFHSLP